MLSKDEKLALIDEAINWYLEYGISMEAGVCDALRRKEKDSLFVRPDIAMFAENAMSYWFAPPETSGFLNKKWYWFSYDADGQEQQPDEAVRSRLLCLAFIKTLVEEGDI